MAIQLGDQALKGLYIWDQKVSAVYVGDQKVRPKRAGLSGDLSAIFEIKRNENGRGKHYLGKDLVALYPENNYMFAGTKQEIDMNADFDLEFTYRTTATYVGAHIVGLAAMINNRSMAVSLIETNWRNYRAVNYYQYLGNNQEVVAWLGSWIAFTGEYQTHKREKRGGKLKITIDGRVFNQNAWKPREGQKTYFVFNHYENYGQCCLSRFSLKYL